MRTHDVLKYFGGYPNIAKQLNLTRDAVYKWGFYVPELQARRLEEITQGKLRMWRSAYPKFKCLVPKK